MIDFFTAFWALVSGIFWGSFGLFIASLLVAASVVYIVQTWRNDDG